MMARILKVLWAHASIDPGGQRWRGSQLANGRSILLSLVYSITLCYSLVVVFIWVVLCLGESIAVYLSAFPQQERKHLIRCNLSIEILIRIFNADLISKWFLDFWIVDLDLLIGWLLESDAMIQVAKLVEKWWYKQVFDDLIGFQRPCNAAVTLFPKVHHNWCPKFGSQ